MARIASIDELDIQHAILRLMSDHRPWSNAELKQGLTHALPWSNQDRQRSPSRPNEFRWENRVNNALSPSRQSSLYGKGHVASSGQRGFHVITDSGLKLISDDWTS